VSSLTRSAACGLRGARRVTPRDDRTIVRRYLAHEAAGLPIEPEARPRLFGEYLVQHRAITREQLLRALIDRERRGGRIGDSIVRLGYCTRWLVELFARAHQPR